MGEAVTTCIHCHLNPLNPDLAVADGGSGLVDGNTLSILLGKGDGTFKDVQRYAAGSHASFVAVADFNRDGIPDLAVANNDSNTVTVLLGNGDGTFQAGQSYAAGGAASSVVAVDLNSDGFPDLAV